MNNYQNPFYNPYGSYQQMRPIGQQPIQQVAQPIQPIQPVQPIQQTGLQGKVVDGIEVVRATDPALDGSILYFPLTDGSSIITKQLQSDGTSKMVVYKPVEQEKPIEVKYVTPEELKEEIEKINTDDLKNIKRQIEDLTDEIDEINKKLKKKE